MATDPLAAIVFEPKTQSADGALIWLHGLGASGDDFAPLAPTLGLPSVRMIFPHAPQQPVTINGGMVMPAWYDIKSLGPSPIREDLDDVSRNAALVEDIIHRQIDQGIPAGRIVLAGFSQGGAMALHVGLRYPVALGGILVLSAYLLAPERLADDMHAANAATPMFFGHGTHDPMVPFAGGKASYEKVREVNPAREIAFHDYPIEHSVSPQEVSDLTVFLHKCFAVPA